MTLLKSKYQCLLGISALALAMAHPAQAQDSVLKRGDAVVTGFSGTIAAEPASGEAVDETFIDADGPTVKILPLRPDAAPAGRLIAASPVHQATARELGQVFAIALDDGLKPSTVGATPNIYLGATSAYGLQIVIPDADDDGRPERVKKGHPNAEWMAGQFGPGGGPGSIWKIDGASGAVSAFATLPGNSGPGVGDIVYDTASLHFYASDLDSGLIHRIDSSGNLIDTFDHGVTGRAAAGLPDVADDGAAMDIRNATFDSQDATTWRLTQLERRVWGLGLHGGRLYYAVAEGPSIWSVSLKLDGGFGDDARREFEVSGTPGNQPVSDVAFDGQGLMYVAQRGGIRGSYDYSAFTDAKSSVVFRYRREFPDDPATPGVWVPVPDEFAIGFPPDHRSTAGGLALGYGYDETGSMRSGMCSAMLWSTGDDLLDGAPEGSAGVHGLQGSNRTLVRPDNEPPSKAYFLSTGAKSPANASGQVGDVEIWQPCDQASFGYGPLYAPLPYLPPSYVPPSYYPPGYEPPGGGGWTWDFNLHVDKAAVPFACTPGGAGFLCSYTVRVTNTGPDPYIGPVTVHDHLQAAPAGATMTFNDPPWTCAAGSPTDYSCTMPLAVLWPGSSIDLKATVDTPAPAPVCSLDNAAHLVWPWGDSDPTDDMAVATAGIPAAHCPPVAGEKTNLKITKTAEPICTDKVGHFDCRYLVTVTNLGPATFNGSFKIDETIPAGTTATFVGGAKWTCSNAAPYSCTHDPDVLPQGASRHVHVTVKVPKNLADDLTCQAMNKVVIAEPAAPGDQNTDATDDTAEASATIPGTAQQCPDLKLSNLKIKKTEATGQYCPIVGGNWECKFNITVQNFGKPMNNEVRFIDALAPGAPVGTTVSFQTPGNWQCNPAFFPLFVCRSANPGLQHMEKAEIKATVKIPIAPTLQCSIKNTALISKPVAPAAQNTFGGDDSSDATAYFEAVAPMNGNPFCVHPPGPPPSPAKTEANLTISKTAGTSTVTASGQNTPFVITVTNTGPGVYAGPIVVREKLPGEPVNASWNAPWVCEGQTMAGQPNDALCAHPAVGLDPGKSVTLNLDVEMPNSYIAPSGSKVTCGYTNHVAIEEAAAGTPQNTNAGDDTASAAVKFAAFEKHGQTFCGSDDLTTPPPPQTCPQGWSASPVAGKCCPPRTSWNGARCSKGDPPDACKPKSCDRGEVWDGGACACVARRCPEGTTGRYPNCKPDVDDDCPAGFSGTPPNCRRIIVDPPPATCPPGYRGRPPRCEKVVETCKPKSCGRGKAWDGDSCACVARDCPEGTVGRYPSCKPKVCPSGFTGTPPNCKSRDCPAGTVGKYPNCRKLPTSCAPGFKGTPPNCVKVPPATCPEGFTGRPPNCRKVAPPKCPSGMRGTPPNCKPVIPPKCPPGFSGRPPNCKKIAAPPKDCPRGMVGKPPNCRAVPVPRPRPQGSAPRPGAVTAVRPGQ
jgi:hypothetical protein